MRYSYSSPKKGNLTAVENVELKNFCAYSTIAMKLTGYMRQVGIYMYLKI